VVILIQIEIHLLTLSLQPQGHSRGKTGPKNINKIHNAVCIGNFSFHEDLLTARIQAKMARSSLLRMTEVPLSKSKPTY
jgi:hypothetical protein